jgi:16S rRNA (guanine1207-N2)-methyltransferase
VTDGIYGLIPPGLGSPPQEATQFSPLMPGAAALEDRADRSLDAFTLLAPPGVLERRYVLAQALRLVKPGGDLLAMAPKDRGGLRLAKELAGFGCAVEQSARRHYRLCRVIRPDAPVALDAATAAGARQVPPTLGLWSQPGVFSWDRLDAGTSLLIHHLPPLSGAGADFGCGVGVLAQAALRNASVTKLTLIDLDRRAIEAARRNVTDPRAAFAWQDVRVADQGVRDLDFVVMNPPFHDGGAEDRALGEAFIRRAAATLRQDGVCWLVANRHLPYERALKTHFPAARLVEQADGYKVYEARR